MVYISPVRLDMSLALDFQGVLGGICQPRRGRERNLGPCLSNLYLTQDVDTGRRCISHRGGCARPRAQPAFVWGCVEWMGGRSGRRGAGDAAEHPAWRPLHPQEAVERLLPDPPGHGSAAHAGVQRGAGWSADAQLHPRHRLRRGRAGLPGGGRGGEGVCACCPVAWCAVFSSELIEVGGQPRPKHNSSIAFVLVTWASTDESAFLDRSPYRDV